MTFIALIPSAYFNVKQYGAACDGTTDDTTAIAAAITAASNAGGGYVFVPGISVIASPLTLSTKVWLAGAGPGTGLKAKSSFSGAEMIYINTADQCGVRDMQIFGGPNTTSAANPAITAAIEVASSRLANFKNLQIYYVNGWAIESIGGASVNNVGGVFDAIHMEHCAQGIHCKGVSGSSYVGQMFFSGIHPEAIDNGDALFFEDINDMEVVNFNGAVAGGATAGSMIHIKGNCASHFFSNIDIGQLAQGTASPTILIETSANGSPTNLVFAHGVVQKGSVGIQITDGSNILFKNVTIKSSNTDGIQISGSTVATPIAFDGCIFQTNNQSNGTCYDVNLTHSTGFSYIRNCNLQSPVGSGAGNVTNPANDTNHRGYFFNTHFAGSSTTPSNCFAGTPQIVRGCPGYNPRGNITAPTITASPFSSNSSQNDVEIIFTAINTLTAFKIGGVSVGVLPVAGTPYHVPARSSLELDYSGAAPTWQWYAD